MAPKIVFHHPASQRSRYDSLPPSKTLIGQHRTGIIDIREAAYPLSLVKPTITRLTTQQ